MPESDAAALAGIRVRDASREDMPAVARIYAHHVLHGLATFEEEPPGAGELDGRRSAIVEHGLPYLVAELAGELLGYAYAGPYRPRPAYRFTVEDSVYIDARHTGRGIGSRLLAALIDRCERAGRRQMVAVIGDSANRPSIVLHARAGFRQAAVLDALGFKFGRWVDTVIMQRALGPGAMEAPGSESPDGARRTSRSSPAD